MQAGSSAQVIRMTWTGRLWVCPSGWRGWLIELVARILGARTASI